MKKHYTHHQLYPWAAISLSAAFLFYKYILQVSPSIMTHSLMLEFKVDGAGLGNMAASFFYAYLVTQLFVGMLLDKYSARVLTTLAIALSAGGSLLFADAHEVLYACIARGMMGAGAAFATVSYMKVASVWFHKNQFAFVGGLLASAAMIGAVFGEAPLAMLVNHLGWRETMTWVGWGGLLCALLFLIIVHDRPKVSKEEKVLERLRHGFSWQEVWTVLKNPQNWLLTFYSGLCFTPVAVFGGLWGTPFLQAGYGFSNTDAAWYVSLVFIGLGVGSPVLGLLSDKLNSRKKVMVLGSILALISMSVIVYVHLSALMLAGSLFLFGFSTGAFMLAFALARDINKLALAATAVSLINTGDGIFGSFTEPMIGKFLDMHSGVAHTSYFSLADYHYALLPLPIYVLVALVLVLLVKEQAPRQH